MNEKIIGAARAPEDMDHCTHESVPGRWPLIDVSFLFLEEHFFQSLPTLGSLSEDMMNHCTSESFTGGWPLILL